jgi:hypothetical protein
MGKCGVMVNKCRVSSAGEENVLELDGSDGPTF